MRTVQIAAMIRIRTVSVYISNRIAWIIVVYDCPPQILFLDSQRRSEPQPRTVFSPRSWSKLTLLPYFVLFGQDYCLQLAELERTLALDFS